MDRARVEAGIGCLNTPLVLWPSCETWKTAKVHAFDLVLDYDAMLLSICHERRRYSGPHRRGYHHIQDSCGILHLHPRPELESYALPCAGCRCDMPRGVRHSGPAERSELASLDERLCA